MQGPSTEDRLRIHELSGSFVAPVVLVPFANHFGWRSAFFLAGAPGLLFAAPSRSSSAIQRRPHAERSDSPSGAVRDVLRNANVLRCVVLSVAFVGYLVMCWTFCRYLTQVRHYDPE